MKATNDFWLLAGLALLALGMGSCSYLVDRGKSDDSCDRIIAAIKEQRPAP